MILPIILLMAIQDAHHCGDYDYYYDDGHYEDHCYDDYDYYYDDDHLG